MLPQPFYITGRSAAVQADGVRGNADSSSAKGSAALRFARELVAGQGRVSDAEFEAVRRAGYSEGKLAEIIAHVALNIFTNSFNNAAEVEVDFPKIALRKSA